MTRSKVNNLNKTRRNDTKQSNTKSNNINNTEKNTTKPNNKKNNKPEYELKYSPHLELYSEFTPITKATKKLPRTLTKTSKKLPYHDDKEQYNALRSVHHGQRKLLLSEIEFLTLERAKYKNKKDVILLYVGAAAGIHTVTLARMFPEFEYHLYDKTPFFHDLFYLPNVKIFNYYFDNNLAQDYVGKNVILISDIRNLDIRQAKQSMTNASNTNGVNSIVSDDLKFQQEWMEIIKPLTTLFKFRLGWKPGKTKYLDGKIYFQAWEGPFSAETRIIPNGKMKVYDNTTYEQQLFNFNMTTRRQFYPHNVPCYGHCYDCATEVHVLGEYIKKFGYPAPLKINKDGKSNTNNTKNSKSNNKKLCITCINDQNGGSDSQLNQQICQLGKEISEQLGKKLFNEETKLANTGV